MLQRRPTIILKHPFTPQHSFVLAWLDLLWISTTFLPVNHSLMGFTVALESFNSILPPDGLKRSCFCFVNPHKLGFRGAKLKSVCFMVVSPCAHLTLKRQGNNFRCKM